MARDRALCIQVLEEESLNRLEYSHGVPAGSSGTSVHPQGDLLRYVSVPLSLRLLLLHVTSHILRLAQA